jgi:RHS repeat-associated protein
MGNRVHWFPTEYLTYGLGNTPLISYKPFAEDGEIYYIADHLGNTRVTLTSNGNITSAKDYEPFGKELHSNGNDRLTFIGKEQDAESDLGDFGVRKYEAEYGRFLSVDRLWEKYRILNSYQYAGNNPMTLYDIDGAKIEWIGNKTEQRYSQDKFNQALNYLEKNGATEAAKRLKDIRDNEDFTVRFLADSYGEGYGDNQFINRSNTIYWNPTIAFETKNATLSPAEVLAHEIDHALQANTNPEQYKRDKSKKDSKFTNAEEKRVVKNETKTAIDLGHLKDKNQPSRNSHKEGIPKKVKTVGAIE